MSDKAYSVIAVEQIASRYQHDSNLSSGAVMV